MADKETFEGDENGPVSRSDTLKQISGTTKRRRFLGGAVAGLAATFGIGGVSARDDAELEARLAETSAAYESPEAARRGARAHGRELFSLLVREGHLSRDQVDDVIRSGIDVSAHEWEGQATAHLHMEAVVDGERIGINVEPETGRQYAVFVDHSGETPRASVLDTETEEVTTMCAYLMSCVHAGCCEEYYIACCPESCYKDGKTGATCCNCSSLNCNWVCG